MAERDAAPPDMGAMVVDLAACADWKKGEEPLILDLRGLSQVTDYFLIVSSVSQVGVRAISEAIIERLRKTHGLKPLHVEGFDGLEWVCIDVGDIIVHVFLTPTRQYYDLEGLWRDAPRVEVPAAALRNFAPAGR